VSGYVRSTPFEGEFGGAKVTADLDQLSFVDLVRIQSATNVSEEELAKIHGEILPRYVKNLSGVKAKDGTDVSIQEVATTAYFFKLATELGIKIAEAATPPQKPSEPSAS
jgi:hypothetical protein